VVEDEAALAQGLVFNLEGKGYAVDAVATGEDALARVAERRYDLILLDVRLPGVDGFAVCQRLRAAGHFTPILMLTARAQPDDVIFGLKMGADDYVVKPFELAELLARVEGLLRRQAWSQRESGASAPTAGAGRRTFGEWWVDFDTFQALTRDGEAPLSQKEISILRVFLARPGQVIARRELLAEVWGLPHHPNERIVDNVIVALRQRFERDSANPRHILSVRGVGYRFVP
jgi:DNA-binding response OmpR family regulator